jgi:hypothetical protein
MKKFRNKLRHEGLKKTAWAGLNTGIQVHVDMQLRIHLQGPQSLAHFVAQPTNCTFVYGLVAINEARI